MSALEITLTVWSCVLWAYGAAWAGVTFGRWVASQKPDRSAPIPIPSPREYALVNPFMALGGPIGSNVLGNAHSGMAALRAAGDLRQHEQQFWRLVANSSSEYTLGDYAAIQPVYTEITES